MMLSGPDAHLPRTSLTMSRTLFALVNGAELRLVGEKI